jgi:hypothetical protein
MVDLTFKINTIDSDALILMLFKPNDQGKQEIVDINGKDIVVEYQYCIITADMLAQNLAHLYHRCGARTVTLTRKIPLRIPGGWTDHGI